MVKSCLKSHVEIVLFISFGFLKSINAIIVYIVITKNEIEKERRMETEKPSWLRL